MKTHPELIAAGHLAERFTAADYDRRLFMNAQDLRSVSFVTTDGDQFALQCDADPALTSGRHKLLNHLLQCVQKHLQEERRQMDRQARRM